MSIIGSKECIICLCPVLEGELADVKVASDAKSEAHVLHSIFHKNCILAWAMEKIRCPLCQERIASINGVALFSPTSEISAVISELRLKTQLPTNQIAQSAGISYRALYILEHSGSWSHLGLESRHRLRDFIQRRLGVDIAELLGD